MKAKKKPLDVKTLADLGIDAGEVGEGGAKIQVVELTPPAERAAGKLVEGETPEEKAANLATLLREEAKAI
jgi:electron transfer flavoprotein beta subunit